AIFVTHYTLIPSNPEEPFGQTFAKTNRLPAEYHRYLIEAEQSRIRSDYDAAFNPTEVEAKENIERAIMFLELANQYLT
ncbi:MAG: HEPN domain-containing protein, partial [Pseudanabaena sp. ELA645]